MASSVLVPVSEYLASSYHPDRDYIDGELKERNMGEEAHAEVQAILARIIGNHRAEWGVRVMTEVRVQTLATHFRIPDVCVVPSSRPRGTVIRYAPTLCIEILSPEDRMSNVQEKVNEYARFGVPSIWVIDPQQRVGYHASLHGFEQPADGVLRVVGSPIEISLAEIFAELDEF
ncbi:Uma2 family endonuclease [Granulicella mallensis]|jgi:Uma2 family endonuclease|uniref:Uma2 family endonuclease n=1 Tax=Granulicella mallensis TaxID=940614 RepID=A0A7W7ZRZ8_9BACT|nr:Uma2 family endonuclease [Granulicella mallensis]MBB5065031.1 Uma2 family endonuclease [Granulicella mallensis]